MLFVGKVLLLLVSLVCTMLYFYLFNLVLFSLPFLIKSFAVVLRLLRAGDLESSFFVSLFLLFHLVFVSLADLLQLNLILHHLLHILLLLSFDLFYCSFLALDH